MTRLLTRALFASALVWGLLGLATPAAAAPFLSFQLPAQAPTVGTSTSVNILLTGLGASEEVGAFQLDVAFDPTILSFADYALGTGLGDTTTESSDLSGGVSGSTTNLVQISFLSSPELKTLQGSGFVLASLNFTALKVGVSPLFFGSPVLSDGEANELIPNLTFATVNVGAAPVPEPASLVLFGLGSSVLALRRRLANRRK